MYEQLHDEDEPIIDDLGSNVDDYSSGASERSVDDLFGLDENSSVLAKLIILNKQSSPVIVTLVFYLGGDIINFLFAGRYIPSDNNSQILAGIPLLFYCTTMHDVILPSLLYVHTCCLSGISLATLFVNVTGYSLIDGMSGAMDTLGSQHNGAGGLSDCM